MKLRCDICGKDLSKLGPLGNTTCPKCRLTYMCEHCSKIHNCAAKIEFEMFEKKGFYDNVTR
jgi:hypothetical protein